ncbi:MAG: 50S ribosomal protein L11 [Candidatus Diapherotrites archaeon]|uniref:Large ribosomal subunit protein uL11 n=1 Tax=Candidatus Iainarchaeum sp. TaxID=3101447 RepID=A0A7J4JVH7_9ARCH|nr:MAG: large subunit ribosomal protein L11 [archaeon GW2011_AR21]MBS3058778.1 50S ribosomal protein L11 [Candidatus Diapherotrites archaeon]HIH21474.1 50S ribosomal protein L11 [Candidatus Diapherotrites archaeon]HIH33199.1 50S ribosomal protein L11 [Candidatus Diapherotrites archaeon]
MSDIKAMIEAGKATAGAPLGPALGPLGVNIGAVVAEINEKTKAFAGMKVPVIVSVDSRTKAFEIKVGSPPASALIIKELGIQKGAANPKLEKVGNMTLAQLKKIAEMKISSLNSSKLKSAMKEIAGTAKQMGITIEGKDAREIIKEIGSGMHDELIGE